MDPSYDIAFKVRLYRVLSERPEFMTADREAVIDQLLSAHIPFGDLDRTLLLHTNEIDRLCGHAVRALTRRASGPVLDTLSILAPERLVSIYYALPAERREAVRKDVAWSYHIENAPPGIEQAVSDVEELAQYTQECVAERDRAAGGAGSAASVTKWHEFVGLACEAGVPIALGSEDAVIEEGSADSQKIRSVLDIFTDELGHVGVPDDEEAWAAACARAVDRVESSDAE